MAERAREQVPGRRASRRPGVLPCMLLGLSAWSASASASSPPTEATTDPAHLRTAADAVMLYRRGIDQYDTGAFEQSLGSFERAYALSRNYQLLFNIAQLQYRLGHFARARRCLERYSIEGGARIEPSRREAVDRQLRELEQVTAVVSLHLDALPATLLIQDQLIEPTTTQVRVIVDVGTFNVEARRGGVLVVRRELRVHGGQALELSVSLAASQPMAAERASTLRGPAVAWAVAGVLALGAAGTGVSTLLASKHYERLRQRRPGPSPEATRAKLDGQRRRVQTLAVTTDSLAVAALIATGVGVYLRLEVSEPEATLAVGPWGLTVSGRF